MGECFETYWPVVLSGHLAGRFRVGLPADWKRGWFPRLRDQDSLYCERLFGLCGGRQLLLIALAGRDPGGKHQNCEKET